MKIRSIIALTFLVVSVSSCLKKRDEVGLLSDSGSVVVGIKEKSYISSYYTDPGDSWWGIPMVIKSGVDYNNASATAGAFTLKLSSPLKSHGDVTVTLAMDNAARDAAIAEGIPYWGGTGYNFLALPTGWFTMPTTVTIPAGSDEVVVPFTINGTNIGFDEMYLAGVKIAAVSEGAISDLENNIVVGFYAKNKYDGQYEVSGTFTDASSAAVRGQFPAIVQLWTLDATHVFYENQFINTPTDPYPWYLFRSATGGLTGFTGASTAIAPLFTMNSSDQVTAVGNFYNILLGISPNSSNGSYAVAIDPSGTNKYDPATKTLSVKWVIKAPSTVRWTATETYKYIGPRP